jgi:hypothetical protein
MWLDIYRAYTNHPAEQDYDNTLHYYNYVDMPTEQSVPSFYPAKKLKYFAKLRYYTSHI